MTSTTARQHGLTEHTYRVIFGVVIAVLVVGALILVTRPTGATRACSADASRALAPTGELSAMGMPVVGTPGSGSGTATAAGVVVDGATWSLGRVPLDVAVRPAWTLRNTSSTPVQLGEPRPEVREGCCPGPLTLGTTTLAPGAETTLTFELSMHAGMDGPHDIAVHVPVTAPTASGHLGLAVTGDFR